MDYSDIAQAYPGPLSPKRTITAPNRLETRNWDLLSSLVHPRPLEDLRNRLRELTGRQHIFFAPSARAAIAKVLALLPQTDVVLPAYTCPVVKTAILVAGKDIIYVDNEKDGLNVTSVQFAEEAKPGRILLPTHIFGLPTDIEEICKLAGDRGCVTIEDAAAALGTKRNGRFLGTYGDIGIFSFEKSKRFPAFRGAAIIVNNESVLDPSELSRALQTNIGRSLPIKEIASGIARNTATAPWIYGRVTLPMILNKFRSREDPLDMEGPEIASNTLYYTKQLHPVQASLVLGMLNHLEEIRQRIKDIVSVYRDTLASTSVMTFNPPLCDDGGLLRFPVVFTGRDRKEVLRRALEHGLYLEINYQKALAEDSVMPRFPNAAWAAKNVVLLPLYPRLSTREAAHLARKSARI